MAKTILTLAIALAAVAVSVSAAGAVAEAAPVPALAQDDVFDYSQYETPPIWQGYKTFGEEFIPINQRPGGARGGDVGRRRRRSLEKRVAIHDDAHLSLDFGVQVDPLDVNLSLKKRAEDLGEDEQYVEEDEEQDEQDEQDEEDEEDEEADEDEEDEDLETDYDNDSDINYDDIAAEEEEDEENERQFDNDDELKDWIQEMKLEEYRNLVGHPEGRELDDEQYQQGQGEDEVLEYIEDPQPSEEEVFAASWRN